MSRDYALYNLLRYSWKCKNQTISSNHKAHGWYDKMLADETLSGLSYFFLGHGLTALASRFLYMSDRMKRA